VQKQKQNQKTIITKGKNSTKGLEVKEITLKKKKKKKWIQPPKAAGRRAGVCIGTEFFSSIPGHVFLLCDPELASLSTPHPNSFCWKSVVVKGHLLG
jgi:hypothetical protein